MKAGGAWIYDNEIASIMGDFADGDLVLVHDFDGYPMGRGIHQPPFQNPDPHDDQKYPSGSG